MAARLRAIVVLLLAAVAVPSSALAITCPGSITDRLHGADVGFVGTLVGVQPIAGRGIPQFVYRFRIDKAAKGELAPQASVYATQLVDLENRKLTSTYHDAVGVIASRSGRRLVTSSCGLVDAGSLLGAADAPKGGGIKVLIGLVIAALVVAYSIRRVKRRGGAPRPNPLR